MNRSYPENSVLRSLCGKLLVLDPGLVVRIVLLLWVLVPTPLSAIPAPDRYAFQTWQTEHGLPQNHSTAILQTREGYLWLGTYNGLVRFDGDRFKVFNTQNTPGLANSRVTSLYQGHHGTLWVGHDAGEVTRISENRFERYSIPSSWPGGPILGIEEDAEGNLWLLHQGGGVLNATDGRFLPPDSNVSAAIPALTLDGRGDLWRVHSGRLERLTSAAKKSVVAGENRAERSPDDLFVLRACRRRAGGLWLACSGKVSFWEGGEGQGGVLRAIRDWGTAPWVDDPVTSMLESRSGLLWVGTQSRGLFLLAPEGGYARFSSTNGLPHDWVRSLGEDSEGGIWIGTGGGLSVARERSIGMIAAPDRFQGRTLLGVHAAKNGDLWIATEGAGIYRLNQGQGQWQRWGAEEGLGNLFVWSIVEDTRGRIFAGSWGGGIFEFDGQRFQQPGGFAKELTPITAMLADPDGSIWVGTQQGVVRWNGDRVERLGAELPRADVRCLARTPDGTLWFGMSGGGLGRLQKGRITVFHRTDGLPNDYVWSLLPDEDGTLWIGTFGGGLGRWRGGKFSTIGESQGLPSSVISALADDGSGQLWIGSYAGILRARKVDLHECADGAARTAPFFAYSKADGLESMECSGGLQPAVTKLADGRLVFPTGKGAAVIDPREVRTHRPAPPVIIEAILIDGVIQTPAASPPSRDETGPQPVLEVPPGSHRYEFQFTAPTFSGTERIRFRHQLEGLEPDWVESGGRRTAEYGFLPPGRYVFKVSASRGEGIWSTDAGSIQIVQLPHIWQTWWFQSGAVCALVALVAWMVRVRTRRQFRMRLEKLGRQRAIEQERARIAKDIHDDLGASLTRISLLSQTALADMDQPALAAQAIERVYSTTQQLTQEMDEIVWAVNPSHDTLESLVEYIGRFAQDFLGDASLRCRLDVPMDLPSQPLSAEFRHNVFLAFKEVLNNVVRHAKATEVRLAISLTSGHLVLRVTDDGKGFSEAAAGSQGGNGLNNIRQRLAEVGGECGWSFPSGGGTVVTFTLPLRKARSSVAARLS